MARIYFNTVLGALGGLIGWVLFSVFGDARASEQAFARRLLLDGAFIGGGIGYLVVSVEAVLDRSWARFARLASYGLVLGALGGAAGLFVAERVNFWLVNLVKDSGPGPRFLAQVLARGLGFVVLGVAVGFSEGVAARSLGRMSYGTLGGGLGGFLGGASFGAVYLLTVRPEPSGAIATGLSNPTTALAGAVGLVILGACIGALSALVKDAFRPASLRVLRGWQEGREFADALREVSTAPVVYAEIPHAQHAFDFYYGSPRAHYTAQAVEEFLSWVAATTPRHRRPSSPQLLPPASQRPRLPRLSEWLTPRRRCAEAPPAAGASASACPGRVSTSPRSARPAR